MSRLQSSRPCLIAVGAPNSRGYRARAVNGKNIGAHVMAWVAAHGAVPPGMTIDHMCENPACVEIEHLQLLTSRDNILLSTGGSARNHRKTHCLNGHPFDEKNTHVTKNGARHCRTCGRDKEAAKRRAAGIAPRKFMTRNEGA